LVGTHQVSVDASRRGSCVHGLASLPKIYRPLHDQVQLLVTTDVRLSTSQDVDLSAA
jgi:hypothetical protein